MDRRAVLGTLSTTLTTGLAGCVSLSLPDGEENDVGMSATAFLPVVFEVPVGETVVWRNTSSRAHTVTAVANGQPAGATYFASGGFDSEPAARNTWAQTRAGNIYSGGTYRHTFRTRGTHHYVCIPHERQGMTGRIEVVAPD